MPLKSKQMKPALRMNSAAGKEILAIVRGGDFAHPGEEEAVRLVFQQVIPKPDRRVLDIGCGRGGTADVLYRLGVGRVTGTDLDRESIEYAARRYPDVSFVCSDAHSLSKGLDGKFDLLCMFNSLYTFEDKALALKEAAGVAEKGAELLVFDYSASSECGELREFIRTYTGSRFEPLLLDGLEELLDGSGWKLCGTKDVSCQFEGWYTEFLKRMEKTRARVVDMSDEETYREIFSKFEGMRNAIADGVLGGVIVQARLSGRSER